MKTRRYEAAVIGGSAGSMVVLQELLSFLPENLSLAIIIVVHLHPSDDGELVTLLNSTTSLKVKEAEDKEKIQPGLIYVCPPNYHLLVELDHTFSLSADPKVNYARPSIDVTLQSAAFAWGEEVIGIILTGANLDGAAGMKDIAKYGGLTIAQDPSTAVYPAMPMGAVHSGVVEQILQVQDIGTFLRDTNRVNLDLQQHFQACQTSSTLNQDEI